jgi:periplasmic protein TonB
VDDAPPPGLAPFGNPSPISTLFDASSASLPQVEKPRQSPSPAAVPLKSPPLLTVGGDVLAAKLITKVLLTYPPLARQIRVSGTVRLIGVVGKDGTLQQLRVVSGHPLLIQAALEAVRQWVYQPTILDGRPVEVTAPIDVIFTLSQ